MQAGEGQAAVGSDVLLQFTGSGHPVRASYAFSQAQLFGGGPGAGDAQLFSVTMILATLSLGGPGEGGAAPAPVPVGGHRGGSVSGGRGGAQSELLRSQQTHRGHATTPAAALGGAAGRGDAGDLRAANSSGYISGKRSYNQLRRMLDGEDDEEEEEEEEEEEAR
jgi:hypothetical protein